MAVLKGTIKAHADSFINELGDDAAELVKQLDELIYNATELREQLNNLAVVSLVNDEDAALKNYVKRAKDAYRKVNTTKLGKVADFLAHASTIK